MKTDKINATQAMAFLGLAPATFYRHRKAGKLPAPVVTGRAAMYSMAQLGAVKASLMPEMSNELNPREGMFAISEIVRAVRLLQGRAVEIGDWAEGMAQTSPVFARGWADLDKDQTLQDLHEAVSLVHGQCRILMQSLAVDIPNTAESTIRRETKPETKSAK